MATISENLQIIADSTAAIKQAIIDKGGTIEGDITTWASAISGIRGGGGQSLPTNIVSSISANENNAKIYEYLSSLSVSGFPVINNDSNTIGITIDGRGIQVCTTVGCAYLLSNGTWYINTGGYD